MFARKSLSLMSLIMFAVLFSFSLNQTVADSLPFSKSGYDYNNLSIWGFKENSCDALYSPIDIPIACKAKAQCQYFNFSLKRKFNALVSEDLAVNLAGNFGFLKVLSAKNRVMALRADRIEFRAPAGHKVDGMRYDGEVQFFFKSSKKSATNYVVSVFLSAEKAKIDSEDVFQNTFNSARVSNEPIIYQRAHNARNVALPAVLRNYFKTGKAFFRYIGSLASPLIGKNVTWFVFEQAIKISRDDFEFLSSKYSSNKFNKGNNAGIQALNGRTVTYAKVSRTLRKIKKTKKVQKANKNRWIDSDSDSYTNKLNNHHNYNATANVTVNATATTNTTNSTGNNWSKNGKKNNGKKAKKNSHKRN